ncbi:MAG: c-type cytochrome [Pirellulales bacterium]|nr:c-type cytochrome [Pirellulales bacterium]
MPANEQTWRDQKLLHTAFGVTGFLMLAGTIWMLAADHTREWKGYQRRFRDVEAWTNNVRLTAEKTHEWGAKRLELEESLAAAQASVPAKSDIDEFVGVTNENQPGANSASIADAYAALEAAPTPATRATLISELDDVLAKARVREENASREMKFQRAELDVVRSQYEAAVGHEAPQPELDRMQEVVNKAKNRVDQLTVDYQQANTFRKQLDEIVARINTPITDATKALADHDGAVKRLDESLEDVRWNWADQLLSMPIIDGFGRPLKIDQIWLPKLTINNNFRDVARFDRCTTCHQGIERTMPGSPADPAYVAAEEISISLATPEEKPAPVGRNAEDEPAPPTLEDVYGLDLAETSLERGEVTVGVVRPQSLAAMAGLFPGDVIVRVRDVTILSRGMVEEYLLGRVTWGESIPLVVRRGVSQPFASHPRLDLFIGSLSPHKLGDLGCTICHEGQGSATDFQWASHTPNTPRQMEAWRNEHGWFDNHHWIFPMYPERFIESTCLKCHHEVTDLEPSERFPEPPAPKVTQGYDLVRTYGCFGCHEILGWDGPRKRIGPDLRTEPNYFAAAEQLLATQSLSAKEQQLAHQVVEHPESERSRKLLAESLKLRIQAQEKAKQGAEPEATEEAETPAEDLKPLTREAAKLANMLGSDDELPGKQRRVGPSLRHLASKVDMKWVYDWVRDPKNFRPSTRMPKFFGLWDHLEPLQEVDAEGNLVFELDPDGRPTDKPVMVESPGLATAKLYEPVEIYSISHYLMQASQPFEYLPRPEGVTEDPSPERGKRLFEQRGCLACHQQYEFPAGEATQGPDLSRLAGKLNTPDGQKWLYSWVREPNRYHTRTVMPNLFLEPIASEVDGQTVVTDPAADITSYLLASSEPWEATVDVPNVESLAAPLDELAYQYLSGTFTSAQAERYLENGIPESLADSLKGDEIVLVGEGQMTLEKKLAYVGRRSIGKYGCFGCHDIPGFEDAKPIGTGLADWGRKDPSRLAFEQIAAYLHGHGTAPGHGGGHGADPHAAAGQGDHGAAAADDPAADASAEDIGFFMHALLSQHRSGFAWQKLRAPRSFDFRKTENKPYNDRLRMPKFPFNQEEIEAVVTFVLGLVAEPPAKQYVYNPNPRQKAIVEGRQVLEKFNCGGCHTMEMETWKFDFNPHTFEAPLPFDDYGFLKPHFPPSQLAASEKVDRRGLGSATVSGMPVMDAEGNPIEGEDDDGNPVYYFTLWKDVPINGHVWSVGGADLQIGADQITAKRPPVGGDFARLIFPQVLEEEKQVNPNVKDSEAWGWLPPPLVGEGRKVQSNWLYEFLQNPYPIRPAVVLRMPKFNMSPDDAQKLVDYFAAVDGASFPYQFDPRTQESHLAIEETEHPGRLDDALKIVTNGNYCIKCHNVGDFEVAGSPKALAPNLNQVHSRLRPDFIRNWLANPKRLLPYTGMPVNFPEDKPADQALFPGTSLDQIEGVVDLLLNFDSFLAGKTSIKPLIQAPTVPPEQAAGAGGGE